MYVYVRSNYQINFTEYGHPTFCFKPSALKRMTACLIVLGHGALVIKVGVGRKKIVVKDVCTGVFVLLYMNI